MAVANLGTRQNQRHLYSFFMGFWEYLYLFGVINYFFIQSILFGQNHTFKEINTIAIQYARSILLHKRRIENNQVIPTE